MAISIAIGLYGGEWLDARFGTKPYLRDVGLGLGITTAFVAFYRLAKLARKEVGDAGENK